MGKMIKKARSVGSNAIASANRRARAAKDWAGKKVKETRKAAKEQGKASRRYGAMLSPIGGAIGGGIDTLISSSVSMGGIVGLIGTILGLMLDNGDILAPSVGALSYGIGATVKGMASKVVSPVVTL